MDERDFYIELGQTSKECQDTVKAIVDLVEEASCEDFWGSEGWKHRMGWD